MVFVKYKNGISSKGSGVGQCKISGNKAHIFPLEHAQTFHFITLGLMMAGQGQKGLQGMGGAG
jgi:hypothetical protein